MSEPENSTMLIVEPIQPPLPIQSTILLIVALLSIPCFSFLLYYLLTTRAFYRALNNHVIVLLLISNGVQTLIDVPVQLSLFYRGIIWPPTVSFCIFYYFIDYYLFTVCFLLITWASFERHILIFHAQLFSTRLKRLVGHYIPLSICCIYPLIYYIIFLLIYPCENYYDESIANCAPACYLTSSDVLALYEQIAHGFAPIFLTFIFNIFLLARVLRQKSRMGQQMSWKKNRRLMVQLLGICCLLLFTNGGFFLIQLVQLMSNPDFGTEASNWIYPLSLCLPPAIAFVCLGTLKEIRQHPTIRNRFRHQVGVTITYIN
jgi:hypothetical protein